MKQFTEVAGFVFLSICSIHFTYGQIVQPKHQLSIGITNDRVLTTVFSSDGKRILAVNRRSTQIWSAETGKLLLTFPEPVQFKKGYWFAWQPGGSTIMQYGALGKKSSIVLWNAETGRKIAELAEKKRMIHAEWNRSGDRVLTVAHKDDYLSGSDFTISIRDEKGKVLRQESEPWLKAAAFSEDGLAVIISARGIEWAKDKAIRVTDRETGTTLRSFDQDLKKSDHWTYAIFKGESSDGKYICADIVLSKGVVCWDTEGSRKPMYFLDSKQTGDIAFMGFSRDSRSFAIRKPKTDVIEIIDAESGNVRVVLDNSNKTSEKSCREQLYWIRLYYPRACSSWSPTGKFFVATNLKKAANIWDTETGKLLTRIPVFYHEQYEFLGSTWVSDYEEFTFNPRHDILLSVSSRSVRVLDPETGDEHFNVGTRKRDKSTDGYQRHIANWSPDGKLLMTAGDENSSVMLWEIVP